MRLFRSVPVADTVFAESRLPAGLSGYARDVVTLGWVDRSTPRGRWTTEAGVEFGTSLPRGTVLADGDCLAIEHPPLLIIVRAKPEPVLVARADSPARAVVWAYQIGNSHQPMMVESDLLVCPDLPGVDQMLAFYGIPFTRGVRPFTPLSSGPGHHGAGPGL